MRLFKFNVFIIVAIFLFSPTFASAGPIIFDTAANPQANPSSTVVSDFNWPFHRFEITSLPSVRLDTVGGFFRNLTGASQDVFAAIVTLSSATDNPDSIDLTTPDVLGTTLISITPTNNQG